jgi:hypothetical protein
VCPPSSDGTIMANVPSFEGSAKPKAAEITRPAFVLAAFGSVRDAAGVAAERRRP